MSALPPILVELKANVHEFMAKMGEARHEVGKLSTEGSAHAKKFAAVGKSALLGFAGVAVGVGGIAVHEALEGEKAHAMLAQAVKNSGQSFEEVEPKVEGLTGKFQRLGFSRDELEQGLAVLTTSLKSPTKALADIGLAADLARYKNISLSEASTIVAKATEGQLRPLKALGIDLPVAAAGAQKLNLAHDKLAEAIKKVNVLQYIAAHTTGKAHEKALKAVAAATLKVHAAHVKYDATMSTSKSITTALAQAVKGQAAAAADTYAGKLNAAKAAATNMAENLGNVLLPIIARLIGDLSHAVTWLTKHKAIAIALGSVIGGLLTTAILAYVYSLAKAAAAQVKTFAEDIAEGVAWVATKIAHYVAVAASAVANAAVAAASWVASNVAIAASSVADAATTAASWIGANVAIAASAIATAASMVASALATAAAWVAANIAMIAATGGIVLAVGALVVAGIYLVKHWRQVWGWIKEAAQAAWSFLKSVFNAIINSGFSPIKYEIMIVKLYFETAWAAIKLAVQVAGLVIKGVIKGISAAFDGIKTALGFLRDVWNRIWGGIHTAVEAAWSVIKPIVDTIKSAVGGVADAIGAVGRAVGTLKSYGGKALGALGIHLATGAYVTSPTMALVGEGREPEYVLPESKLQHAVDAAAARGGGGGGDIHVHLYVDGKELHTSVRKADREFRLRNGRSAFA